MIRKFAVTAIFFTLLAGSLAAQPAIGANGIVNAASYSLPGLPSSSIAQGSMFIVFGTGLGATSDLSSLAFPLLTSLDGTSITVKVGSASVSALMIYTTPTQVAAILPSTTPAGAGTLTLTYNGASSSASIQVAQSSFGAFTLNSAGTGPSIIQQYTTGSGPQPSLNGILNPAHPGDTLVLWGTGLGPVSGNEANGPVPGDMTAALGVEVWIGSQKAGVTYAGRSGCCGGLDQVVFVMPNGVQGCYVSVAVKAGGVVGNFTSMAVASTGSSACSDANGIDSSNLQTVQSAGAVRLGVVQLTRQQLTINAGALGTISSFSDLATSVFGSFSGAQLSSSLGLMQSPSVGYCFVSTFIGLDPTPIEPTHPTPLNAGPSLSISGAAGNKTVAAVSPGIYSATVGGVPLDQLLSGNPGPSYLDPGAFTITDGSGGTGANAVGAFSGQLTLPPAVNWTNSAQITDIQRSNDLTITWSGGDPNAFVAITGIGVVAQSSLGPSTTSPGAAFLCIAPATPGTFTVPSVVLQALPASTNSIVPTGFLLVGQAGVPVKFTAPGLDAGYLDYRVLNGQSVNLH